MCVLTYFFFQFQMELDTITSDEEADTLTVGTRGHHVTKWKESVCISGGYTKQEDDQYRPQLYYPSQAYAYCLPSTDDRLLPPCPVKWFSPVVIDDNLVTVGGVDRRGQPTNKLYHWNEFMQRWDESFPPMITPRLFATSVLYQSYLIVIGGAHDVKASLDSHFTDVVEVLDITSKQWYRTERLPTASGNKQAAIIDDTLFLLSGWLPNWRESYTSAWYCSLPQLLESIHGIEIPLSKKSKLSTAWKTMESPLPSSAIVAVGKYLVAVGGWETQDDKPSDIIQCYHLDSMQWQHIGKLAYPRAAGAAIVFSEDKVLVFGGRVGACLHSTKVECITLTM